jgi:hypothetical protein
MNKILLSSLTAAFLSTSALAHTNSVGYVGDGTGGLNFYYGSWHNGTTFNEAEIKIIDSNNVSSISAFNLLEQNSPAGLLTGVNYFGSDGTTLIPYDITLGGGESYTWQGINYQNLTPGQYTFVYIPLQDIESTLCPLGTVGCASTADWMPMDNVIRSLTVTITQGDLNGDANQNGILDILEVLSGQASGGATVVSQGSSTVLGYIAVAGGVLQVISRTQTDTTWDNMSDGTTTNTQTTITNLTPFSGRTDQGIKIENSIDVHTLGFATGFIAERTISNMGHDESAQTNHFGFGFTDITDDGVIISGGFNKLTTDATSGSMSTLHLGVGVAKSLETVTVRGSINTSDKDISYTRTIGSFTNYGSYSTTDRWADIEVEPNTGSIRPVAGITIGNRTNDGWTEIGSTQSAISHNAIDKNYMYATFGLNLDLGIGTANISRTTEATTRLGLGIDYLIKENVNITADINRSIKEQATTTGISASLIFMF